MIKYYNFFIRNKISVNKKYFILNALILFVVLFFLITTLSFSTFIDKFIQLNYNQNYQYKKLFVSYDTQVYSEKKAIELISEFPNIDLVSSQTEFFTPVDADINNSGNYLSEIYLVSCNNKTVPNILNGEMIRENSIIIPDNFKPNGNMESINGKDLIGKQIKIRYNIQDYTPYQDAYGIVYGGRTVGVKEEIFSILGTYDSDEYFETNSSCYVLNSDLDELSSDNIDYMGYGVFHPLVVICDYYDNIEKVISDLGEIGMYANKAAIFNTDFIDLVVMFGYLVVIIFIILSIITTWSSLKLDLHKNKVEYALLKCMGYKDKDLFALAMAERFFVSAASIIASVCASLFAVKYIGIYIKNSFDIIGSYNIEISLKSLIIGILISFILPTIIISLNYMKLRKISPIEAYK